MNRAAVIYASKYGSTKQYAEWIAETLPADIVSLDEVRPEDLKKYDLIIAGGWMRVGKIMCADFIIDNWEMLKEKKVVVFSVSATRPTEPVIQQFFEGSFPSTIHAQVRFFPLWGRFSEVDMADKFLMLVPRTPLSLKLLLAPSEESKSRYKEITQSFDHVERTSLQPLLQ